MHMHKMLILLGVSAIALGVQNTGAEARKRTYEIQGQRYTYETSDPAQVAVARKRIEAANAADAAKAKAEAEKVQNPLASVFGSPAQREASQAQAHLQQVLAESQPEQAAARPRDTQQATSGRRGTRNAEEASITEKSVAQKEEEAGRPKTVVASAGAAATAEPLIVHQGPKKVKSISFDVETGIKSIVLVDGSVEEEPFDSSALSQLLPVDGKANSLTAFVEKLRKAAPEEATGSITPVRLQSLPAPKATAQP